MGVDWCQGFLEPPAYHSGISVSDRKTPSIFYIYASDWSECAETPQVSGKIDKVLMTHLHSPVNIGRKT